MDVLGLVQLAQKNSTNVEKTAYIFNDNYLDEPVYGFTSHTYFDYDKTFVRFCQGHHVDCTILITGIKKLLVSKLFKEGEKVI